MKENSILCVISTHFKIDSHNRQISVMEKAVKNTLRDEEDFHTTKKESEDEKLFPLANNLGTSGKLCHDRSLIYA
ncbi:CLUMA_CG013988, isoform A [Clunio marinus]|uniref:CLUMA_CG013988, isoform A n=1 Tax=Clunio marinus TaxID=568069 RepID=A0A1J1IME4_9DIPT|nr:CLUMA_CG013988, isoform A [Clunio marinus]